MPVCLNKNALKGNEKIMKKLRLLLAKEKEIQYGIIHGTFTLYPKPTSGYVSEAVSRQLSSNQ